VTDTQRAYKGKPGLGVSHDTWDKARDALRLHLASFIPAQVVTLTPEMCVRAHDDPEFRRIIDNAAVVVADGVGVVWGHGRLTSKRPEKIPGIDLAAWALEEVDRIAERVYLLGARPEVVEKAAESIGANHPRLSVAGWRDGYFAPEDEKEVVSAIASTSPHLLLVGMGSPKQEMFIARYLTDLRCAVAMGVGGSFDVWEGGVRRAPAIFRKTGTEWVYRVLTQPGARMRRLPILLRFISIVNSSARSRQLH